MKKMSKGDIYYASLDPIVGSEQCGKRPILIIQDDTGTKNSQICIIAPLTRMINKKYPLRTHVYIGPTRYLKYYSVILLEHTRSISKDRLGHYIGKLTLKEQILVDKAILNTFDLNDKEKKVYEI